MTSQANPSRRAALRSALPLLLPVLAGVLLRFYSLGSQSLFLDELWSADLALRPWGEMVELASRDVHPLLYYALLKLSLGPLPLAAWSLRLLSAACSALALALAVGIAYRLAGARAATAAGWLLAWSSLHLYYAQEARMYSLLELLWLVAPWLLAEALERRAPLWWAGWALAAAAAVHTQLYGFVLWGTGAGLALATIAARRSWADLRPWLIAQVAVACAAAPLVTLIVFTIGRGVGGTWVPAPLDLAQLWALSLLGFASATTRFLNGDLLAPAAWRAVPFGAWAAAAGLALLAALPGWWRGMRGRAAWLVAGFGLAPLLLAFGLLWVGQLPFWAPRPLLGVIDWLLIGVAIGWARLPRPALWAVLACLLAINSGSLWAYESRWIKDYGGQAFGVWPDQVGDRRVLVLDRPASTMSWRFYDTAPDRPLVLSIVPTPEGFVLRRMLDDGTLRGTSAPASCDDLPEGVPISLYDPSARWAYEGARWPACLAERAGWRFDRNAGRWLPAPSLLQPLP